MQYSVSSSRATVCATRRESFVQTPHDANGADSRAIVRLTSTSRSRRVSRTVLVLRRSFVLEVVDQDGGVGLPSIRFSILSTSAARSGMVQDSERVSSSVVLTSSFKNIFCIFTSGPCRFEKCYSRPAHYTTIFLATQMSQMILYMKNLRPPDNSHLTDFV